MVDELKQVLGILETAKYPDDLAGAMCIVRNLIEDESNRATQVDDSALIKLMISACDELEDLEDCMRESLNAIRPYLRTPPDKAATIEKMARAMEKARMEGFKLEDRTNIWNYIAEKAYEAEHE